MGYYLIDFYMDANETTFCPIYPVEGNGTRMDDIQILGKSPQP